MGMDGRRERIGGWDVILSLVGFFCFSGGHRILPKRIFCNELKLRKFEGREHQLNGYVVLLFLALIIKIKFCTFS
jgi:hypothetical protein